MKTRDFLAYTRNSCGSYDPDRHHRRSIRLKGYDYARAGAYFVTVVAQGRQCLFGRVAAGAMVPNAAGELIRRVWHDLPARFPGIRLDAFVVMPNHVHGIIVLAPDGDGMACDIDPLNRAATRARQGYAAAPTGHDAQCDEFIRAPEFIAHDDDPVGAPLVGAHSGDARSVGARSDPAPTLGTVVGAFKSLTTVAYGRGVEAEGWPAFERRLWQRNYYEQIIRDEAMWAQVCRYIHGNAANWSQDEENPERAAP
jgi:putative transposase